MIRAEQAGRSAPRPAWNKKRTTQAQRQAAAIRARNTRQELEAKRAKGNLIIVQNGACVTNPTAPGCDFNVQGGKPDVFGVYPNWTNSPRLKKFVNALPVLGIGANPSKVNENGQYLPVAVPDTNTYPGADYYEISLVEYQETLYGGNNTGKYLSRENPVDTEQPITIRPTLRGYVQTNKGTDGVTNQNTVNPASVHYLGPIILATKDKPVRIKFTNTLPTGPAGKMNIPVDVSVLGAGPGPNIWNGSQRGELLCSSAAGAPTPAGCYTENRATLHLHGGRTPWISDGTPHQWITPVGESTNLTSGMSKFNVPDMPDPGPGAQTFYWTNQQSSRLMFYHDHAAGITRLNVYVGEAAGYVLMDTIENELISQHYLPGATEQIPLVIQDKTFVNTEMIHSPVTVDPVTGNWTGPMTQAILATDPTWNWGSGAITTGKRAPVMGDLWWPHVYVPAQNPYDMSGVNPWGRWAYGPWFWPPTGSIPFGPVLNELYDQNCNPDLQYCQPYEKPGVPNVSWGGEAFLDTPVINGTVFPYLEVEPKIYRFRILNAAHDRFWNLQLYKATGVNNAEVPMVDAAAGPGPTQVNTLLYPTWPVDGRQGGLPDPTKQGPSFWQIGSEGGFLPRPVEVPNQPIAWNIDPTTFNFGNVSDHGLLLGPAERADVLVDFSAFAGQTLILYNDAPAAFPALDARLDYYSGYPNMTDTGGTKDIKPGYGPNTRTLMQIRVGSSVTPSPTNVTHTISELIQKFSPTDTTQSVFERGQEPIIVGQKMYNARPADLAAGIPAQGAIYKNGGAPITFPGVWPNWGLSRIQDSTIQFFNPTTILTGIPTEVAMQPKAIHDEMGAAYDDYGRMSAKLGVEMPFTTNLTQNFVIQNYVDPTTETVRAANASYPDAATASTQLWKITHNGVDTHPVHFHIFDVQLVNRVGWDGAIRVPDENELGWKDTIRMSPLEDTIVAIRPAAPRLPFGIPDSVRPLNPAIPINAVDGFTNINTANGQPMTPPTTNVMTNFGWEYVWHCHILSHEEADMMRPIKLDMFSATTVPLPSVLSRTPNTTFPISLTWTDPTQGVLGNLSSEIGFRVYRATVTNGTPGGYTLIATTLANQTTYVDTTASATLTYNYRVVAYNAKGVSPDSNILTVLPAQNLPAAPSNLTAAFQAGSNPATVALSWQDNATDETSFLVERATNNTFTANLVSIPVNLTGPATGSTVTYNDTTVVVGTTYYYRVSAVRLSPAAQSVPSNTATIVVASGVNTPINVTASLVTGPRINIAWTDNSTGETGFTVQRTDTTAAPPVVSSLAVPLPANTTTYADMGVATGGLGTFTLGHSYSYCVIAVGSPSSACSAPAVAGAPARPTNLVPSAAATGILLTWNDNSNNEQNFTIQRSTSAAFDANLATFTRFPAAGTGTITYADTGAAAGVSYYYRVRSNNQISDPNAWVNANAAQFPFMK